MTDEKNLVFSLKSNELVINYLMSNSSSKFEKFIDDKVEMVSLEEELGVHPDIVQALWYDFTTLITLNCHRIVLGFPVLINPNSGKIFAFAEGMNPPILRVARADLPEVEIAGGARLLRNLDGIYADITLLDDTWRYCFSDGDLKTKKWFLAAFSS